MPGKRGGVTLKELQAKAKAAKVKGWSKMSKAELMQRVGGGGAKATPTPTKKRPVTTAKRYEATKVAGAIAARLGKAIGIEGSRSVAALQDRLLKSVKKAVSDARKKPGATDQDVRKAVGQAVKSEVQRIRSLPFVDKKSTFEKGGITTPAKTEPVSKKKRSTRSKSKPVTPPTPNDEAKRRAEIEAKNRARTEALRAKHGGDAVARAQAYREKGRGNKDKYQAGVRLVRSAASRQDNSRIDGAITRTELDRTQKALNRRARKTGKQVSVTRNLDYNPGEGKRDIHKATLTGSTEKGGMESRRPPRKEKSKNQNFDDLAGAFGSSPTSKQKSSKTTAGTPQKQKSSSSTHKSSTTTSTPQKQRKTRTASTSRKKND